MRCGSVPRGKRKVLLQVMPGQLVLEQVVWHVSGSIQLLGVEELRRGNFVVRVPKPSNYVHGAQKTMHGLLRMQLFRQRTAAAARLPRIQAARAKLSMLPMLPRMAFEYRRNRLRSVPRRMVPRRKRCLRMQDLRHRKMDQRSGRHIPLQPWIWVRGERGKNRLHPLSEGKGWR